MIRLRHTDEWVGLLVVAAAVLFIGAMLEAGIVRDWFRTVSHLRIVLPPSGVGGLVVGADVEVLGTHAGTVRRIVLNPNQQMYAEADIDAQATAFIRRDSQAIIRRRFGVAGAAYVDVLRGAGAPLDWTYAVIDATTERAPTDTVSAMIDEIRQRVEPVIDDTRRTMAAVASVAENLQAGRGSLGRLLTDDSLALSAEQAVEIARAQVAALAPVIAHLDNAARQIDDLAQRIGSTKDGVPDVIRRADAVLRDLQSATRDLARATPSLPETTNKLARGTADLPALLTQIQITASEVEQLATQLRGLWLLGGGGGKPPPETRLPAASLQP